jgi:cytidylate kinase
MATNIPIGASNMGLGNMDMLKSQILTMFALRSSNSEDGIFMAIWAIILITCIDSFFRFIPVIMQRSEALIREYVANRVKQLPIVSSVSNEIREEASILLIRNYKEKEVGTKDMQLEYELVDAVIEHICSQDNSRHLRYTNKYHINNNDVIHISKDIQAKMEHISLDNQTNQVDSICLRLKSTTLKVSHIKEYLSKIHATYRMEKCNKLGSQRYYFNEFHIAPMPDMDGGYRFETAPKRITFNMTPFNTFKSISNIFGSHIQEVRDRVNLFCNNPEWYSKRGIPHTLGILLHGKPGCGKTSLIKAIARDTNRHVFNISLRKTTTQRQLLNLFFDENLTITNAMNETSTIAIPLDQRIYVIEDIDCMTDVVLDREYLELLSKNQKNIQEHIHNISPIMNTPINILEKKDDINQKEGKKGSPKFEDLGEDNFYLEDNKDFQYLEYQIYQKQRQIAHRLQNPQNPLTQQDSKQNGKDKSEAKEELTLSFLLNLLDGVLETPGRILIITSNFPERLDKALVRPGRIDLNIHFDYADLEMITEMLVHFYNLTKQQRVNLELDARLDKKFTPAEVIAVLCNYYKDINKALEALINKL